MAVVTPPGVDTLPPTPSSSAPTTFAALADTFFAALANFRAQLVALGANIFSNATDAASSASTASAAQTAAALSAAAASNAAGAAAVNAAAPVWVSGMAYAQYAAALSPTDFRVYRRKTAGSGTVDPSLDTTNWTPVLTPITPYIHARETQPSGTASAIGPGGGAFGLRNLNGAVGGVSIPGAALNGSGGVILPAGTYEFDADACFATQSVNLTQASKLSLYNATDGIDIVVGPNVTISPISGSAPTATVNASVRGRFTLTTQKTVALRQWFSNGAPTAAGGYAIGNGQVEVYASLIMKMIGQ